MQSILPLSAGIGLKPDHFRAVFERGPDIDGLWVEVHAENYMVEGGPRLAWLEMIADRIPVSLHGVGLSLAGPGPANDDHLRRWSALVRQVPAAAISEHLAWSVAGGQYFADLLPVVLDEAALTRTAENVARFQDAVGRQILIENPAHYLPLRSEIPEPDFLAELARRTGCGLLIDLNNLAVGEFNTGRGAREFLTALPRGLVGEYHIAGATSDPARDDLLIDSHDAPVADPVWDLLAFALDHHGRAPVQLERDGRLPPFETLLAERGRARDMLGAAPANLTRAARTTEGLHEPVR